MSATTSAAPASATTTYPAVSTPNGPSGIPISRIGAIIGGVLGGVIFLLLVSLGIIFFFCSAGRRPGRSRNVRIMNQSTSEVAPGWAKMVLNAEKSYGAGHDQGPGHAPVEETPKKNEKRVKIVSKDLEEGRTEEPQKKKGALRSVLPWGQHDAQEYIREQQERQRQLAQQQHQYGQMDGAQQSQYGYTSTSDERQGYEYANTPQQASHAQLAQQQQQYAQQMYYQHPQAGVQVQMPEAAYQQQGYGAAMYYPAPGVQR